MFCCFESLTELSSLFDQPQRYMFNMHDKTSIHCLFLFIIVFGFVFDFCIQFLLPCGCVAYAFYGIFVVFQLRSLEKINQTFYISHALPQCTDIV